MSELEFLQGEAKIASASAPDGLAIEVVDGGKLGRFDVLFGGKAVARFLERESALACLMGIGGALAVLAHVRPPAAAPCAARRITVVDRCMPKWKKTFRSVEKCREWLMDGNTGCEGAERDHYVGMLVELNGGATVLHYN